MTTPDPMYSQPQQPQQPDNAPQPPNAPPYAGATGAPRQTPGVATNTPWIWLAIFVPFLPTLFALTIDWEMVLLESVSDPVTAAFPPSLLLLSLFSTLVLPLHILFAFLDQRALTARGIDRPFPWFWSFTALVVGSAVYPIGRAIVAKRRTGAGLAPLFATIGVMVASLVIGTWLSIVLFTTIVEIGNQLA